MMSGNATANTGHMNQELTDLLMRYRAAWQANSASRIETFWDLGEPMPFYKAEEIGHIITDWDELRSYWRHNEGFNEVNELSYSDFVSRPAGEDRLLLGMRMRWDIRFADDARNIDGSGFAWAGQVMGGENHVAACLNRCDGSWKFSAWVEAPDAPLLYMADLYRKNVRPDFPGAG